MYRIFNLVNEIDAVEYRLAEIIEYDMAGAPDYEEYFEERQISYAVIGKSCFALVDRLRALSGLPKRVVDERDFVERMEAQKNGLKTNGHSDKCGREITH
uniref:Uncharacterized protein n=1 Tax=Candidatus Kentrum sp. FW TaxID=2126338 RepID=A0A450U2M6_9GAMM|nr:MAG: hypothetical protein BECKFW1821C_GA0114237_11213 [Candidatus Kentron sp. FW]